MASISFPLQHQNTSAFPHFFESADSPPSGRNRRNLTMSTPLPNPHFVFPARNPDSASDQPQDSINNGPAPLPEFSFNPGSTSSIQASVAAPPSNPSNRTSGHRRRCSEFIGSEPLVIPGNLNTNHTTEDGLVTTPVKLPAPGPGFSSGGRRRHAHRRSAAISSVDLTAITNALDPNSYAESAPCTPADLKNDQRIPGEPPKPFSYSATSIARPTPPDSPQIVIDGTSLYPQDPTDLPILSARPSGEASSRDFETTSLTAAQPETPDKTSENPIPFAKDESPFGITKSKPRPRTADASLMLNQGGMGLLDDSSSIKRPLSAARHSRSHKSMSSGMLDAVLKKDSYDDDSLFIQRFRISSSDDDSDTSTDDFHEVSGSPSSASKKRSKTKKRQKKVRSWAGAILTRGMGKRHQPKKDTPDAEPAATPPVLTRTNSDLGSGLDVDFDDDNIVVIRTPTNPTTPELRQGPSEADTWASLEDSWKPRSFYEQNANSDALSPVIDLDAALGPFNTPDMRSGRVPESGFSAATRRMYSGGRRGEFVGPEMRYHRRAESAPEMPPFDRSFLGSNRFPTTSSLENPDVFYEEEEDAFLAATSESGRDSEEHLQTQVVVADSEDADEQSDGSKDSSDTLTGGPTEDDIVKENSGLGIQQSSPSDMESTAIASSVPEEHRQSEQQIVPGQSDKTTNLLPGRPKTPIDLAKHEDWQHRIPVPPSPDISPRFLPVDHRPITSPIEIPSTIPPFSLHGPSSLPNSSFPSPDFTVSSEAPRSITTPSTADQFHHASMEDIPSLTSSASTMTNTLNRVSATFFARPRMSTDRSSSYSATVPRRSSQPGSSKRSSLASLSKLVVGPHTERSKLSHEEKPPGDEYEKAKKKGHRISRLMHFWRTKDKDRLNENTFEE